MVKILSIISISFGLFILSSLLPATSQATSYTITASAGSNGTLSPSGPTNVTSGASQAFTVIPTAGYYIASITVDGIAATLTCSNTYTFLNVSSNHTIATTFSALPANSITTCAGINGTISPGGTVSVSSEASQTFTITPAYDSTNAVYYTPELIVDGAVVPLNYSSSNVYTYTFNNVTGAHTIIATFIECVDNGVGSPLAPGGMPIGTTGCAADFSSHISSLNADMSTNITDCLAAGSAYSQCSLSSNLSLYHGLPTSTLNFAANLLPAFYSSVDNYTATQLESYVLALHKQGLQRVDFNPALTTYTDATAMANYAAVVSYAHSLGMKVGINPGYSPAKDVSITSFNNSGDPNSFQSIAMAAYAAYATLQPDNFVLIHEPSQQNNVFTSTTGQPQISSAQWVTFIKATLTVVQQASPSTQLGVGFAADENGDGPFYSAFSAIPGLNFLSFDMYKADYQTVNSVISLVGIAKNAGLYVYMEETAPLPFESFAQTYVPANYLGFEPLDIQWMNTIALFGATLGLQSITYFQSPIFFLYEDSYPWTQNTYTTQLKANLGSPAQTTGAYTAFQSDVALYGGTTYTLNVTAVNGTVGQTANGISSSGPYAAGTVVTLTATPASGYQFSSWSGSVTGTGNPMTVTMNANETVTANFIVTPPVVYTLNVNATNGTVAQTVSGLASSSPYNVGTVVTLTATPSSGYQFNSWSGGVTGTNNPATVTMNTDETVTANFIVDGVGPPIITTQPTNLTVDVGQTSTFSVVATGAGPLSYQWQQNGANIPGANSASYTVPPAISWYSGLYLDVIVSNTAGTITSNQATLTVNTGGPSITQQPASLTVDVGQTSTFSVVATGAGPLSYQWQQNGANIPGANSASYTVPAAESWYSGLYLDVIVSNTAGAITSNVATLTVKAGWPGITTQPANLTVDVGQTSTFSVVATGTGPLSYQWQQNGVNIPGANSASYTIPAAESWYSGLYLDVIVSNSVGSITSNIATLTVKAGWPTIITQPASQTVDVGEPSTFSVVATGTGPLSYQWQQNGVSIPGANSASYTIPAAESWYSGLYLDVIVTNSVGSVTSNIATLTIKAGWPAIITQPASQTVDVGQTSTFSVVATGTGPLSYQWQQNGVSIPGANSASYTVPAAESWYSGLYLNVIVSNSAGTVTSNAATLTVAT